jgi:hypothetical protein
MTRTTFNEDPDGGKKTDATDWWPRNYGLIPSPNTGFTVFRFFCTEWKIVARERRFVPLRSLHFRNTQI